MNELNESLVINAIDSERGETRVAHLKNGRLERLIELNENTDITKGDIFSAKISSNVPSLEAYFVDYGEDKHGFLPYKETIIDPKTNEHVKYKTNDQVMVQITKEERGTKGAALSNELTVPGIFLVLLPFSPKTRGISKNINEEQRKELEEKFSKLQIPENIGIIARTAAKDRSLQELQNDLNYLTCLWGDIQEAVKVNPCPSLIFSEGHGIHKIIRDTIRPDLAKIVIDHEPTANIVKKFISSLYPQLLDKIVLHSSSVPVFTHYQIEDSVESMFSREIPLRSGGRLVIDRTEALFAIDVNSAQATKADTVEKTALQTNLEAVREIAHVIRLREIHGIIAIDLIDMQDEENKKAVVREINKHVADDKSRVYVAEAISELGILEISRQRTRPSLSEMHLMTCPQCTGRGFVRTPLSFVYSLLHIIEQHAIHGKSNTLIVSVPIETGIYLNNEKHDTLREIERRQGVSIKIIPSTNLSIPHYSINRIRNNDYDKDDIKYKNKEDEVTESIIKKTSNNRRKPVITNKNELPKLDKKSLVQKIFELFSGEGEKKAAKKQPSKGKKTSSSNRNRNSRNTNRKRNSSPNNRRGPKANSKTT